MDECVVPSGGHASSSQLITVAALRRGRAWSGPSFKHLVVLPILLLAAVNGVSQSSLSARLDQSPSVPERRFASPVSVPRVALLPQQWVNQHECDGTATVNKVVCHKGDWQCPNGPGDYDTTSAGLRQALLDAENLRLCLTVSELF